MARRAVEPPAATIRVENGPGTPRNTGIPGVFCGHVSGVLHGHPAVAGNALIADPVQGPGRLGGADAEPVFTGSTGSVGMSRVSVELMAQLPPVGNVATDTVPVSCEAGCVPERWPDRVAEGEGVTGLRGVPLRGEGQRQHAERRQLKISG